tara:strand:- start:3062 stop:3286 length:225 start_codon:yes stop_codon:yes gene_type:complete
MPEKPSNLNNCQTEGIFSPVAGILGSLQANEVLKEILNFKSILDRRLIIFDSVNTNFRSVKLSFNPECKNKCSK